MRGSCGARTLWERAALDPPPPVEEGYVFTERASMLLECALVPCVEVDHALCVDAVLLFPTVLGKGLEFSEGTHLVTQEHLRLRQTVPGLLE